MADLIQHDELRAIFGPEMPIIAVKLLWTPDRLTVDELRQLMRGIAALPAQGVRVKPLVWEAGERDQRRAYSPAGEVVVTFFGGRWHHAGRPYGGMLEAQAAAQADYEARILAALAPAEAGGVEAKPFALAVDREQLEAMIEADPVCETEAGASAKREGNPSNGLVPGEVFFTFPTEEQANLVADALCNTPAPVDKQPAANLDALVKAVEAEIDARQAYEAATSGDFPRIKEREWMNARAKVIAAIATLRGGAK